jgi:cytochrome oxidase Cu insertion factor (SCO1/SenC/PrrC family)
MRKFGIVSLMFVMAALVLPSWASAQGNEAPEEMTGIKVGETFPSFTLKDQSGEEQSLEGLLAKEGTTAIVFFRSANW